jgi:hypothetical protein
LRKSRFRTALDEPFAMLRLAVPIMLIALVNMGMSVTDTIMVSAMSGPEALAAVAVGSDFYSILFYLGAGTIGGLVPIRHRPYGLDLERTAERPSRHIYSPVPWSRSYLRVHKTGSRPDRQMRLLRQADDLKLFSGWVSHSWSPPVPLMLF